MKIAKSTIDSVTDRRVNRRARKTKALFLAAGFAALLLASSSIAFSQPPISVSSEHSVRIVDARIVSAPGGGSYVTGLVKPSFGYAPHAVNVHVAAFDGSGQLLGQKVDHVNTSRLVRWHLHPNPRAGYTVFLPWEPARIAKVSAWTE